MLLLMLLAASLVPAQRASMACTNIASVETQPLRGPAAGAALKISSADDHSKNTHLCWADYDLLITRPGENRPLKIRLLSSDGYWERRLTAQLDGFSQDGNRIVGVISESGKPQTQTLFEHNLANGKDLLLDLQKPIAHVVPKKCRATANVVGETATGALVVQLHSVDQCAPNTRWLVNSANGLLQPLGKESSVVSLYHDKL